MKEKKKNFIHYLDNRIGFYRYCMVGTFILGILAGTGILCGESTFVITEWSDLKQVGIKLFFCFLIAATGIATGSAYRRRILHLKEHRNKILLDSYNRQFFPKPAQEQIIMEVQALFGILFFLSAVIVCIHYPIPKLPDLLDCMLIRLIPVIGFVGLCWISVNLERKNSLIRINPLQDFLDNQQKRVRIQSNRRRVPPAYRTAGRNFPPPPHTQEHANRSIHQ